MRILRRDIKHDTVTVLPQVLEDFWVLYNIIQKGDRVYARTTREVRFGDRYDRAEKGKRISISLGVSVERVVWDRYLNQLRVHGIVCDAPDDIGAAGSRHTLNVTLNKPLAVVKEEWLKYQLDQLDRATTRGVSPIAIIGIDDEGYCVAILRGFGLDTKAEERINLPGKLNPDERTKALQELFKSASRSLEEVRAASKTPVVVLGLGFIKNQFVRYLEEKKPELKADIIDVKSVNSTGQAGLNEALRSGILTKALKHVRIAEEAEAVEEVLKRLARERATVTYGLTEVESANSLGAIEQILLTDKRLREADEEERRSFEKLIREVEEKRGKVTIVSTEHEAGVKLNSLGGIAALLRFPIH